MAAFEFVIRPTSDPVSIRLTGQLTLGPHLLEFSRHVHSLLASRKPSGIMLDVAGIADIDSAGLGELVILYTSAGQYGCRLCLVRPTPRTIHILEMTKLAGILVHFDNEQAATDWVATE